MLSYKTKQYQKSIPKLNIIPRLPKTPRNFPIILIGAGAIVNLAHLPAYKLAGFRVEGIYDVDNRKSIDVANQWNISHVYKTLDELFTTTQKSNENFIFDLAIPSSGIYKVLEQIPKHSHVLLQKPLGECLADAQSIVNICKQRQINASVNFQLRYAPYILALKDAIQRGWLGNRLTTIEIHVNVYMPWTLWPFLSNVSRLELVYHSIHYVDLIRDLLYPNEPTGLHCRTSKHAAMPHLTSVRSCYSFEYKHDPMLYVNIYTNHHHRWGTKHAQSYILVEGTEGAAKAQIGDNLAYGQSQDAQTDYLQICSDRLTNGEWVDVDLQGRTRFPHAFIGPMAAAICRYENISDRPLTDIDDALKTMKVLEAAWESSNKNLTPIS